MLQDDAVVAARPARGPRWLRTAAVLSTLTMAASLGTVAVATSSGASGRSLQPAAMKKADASSGFLACEVTDTGGINDRSFNASAYAGLKVAAAAVPGLKYAYLGSTSTSDYTPNINTFIGEKCGIIVTVGFDMGNATQTAAQKYPSSKFAIVDYSYSPNIKNVLGLTYETNQDAFLGGYLAAAMTKSGILGTYGGQNIPPVTIYMDGWVAGVRYYNKVNNAHVKVLGWKPTPGRAKGSFAGNGLFVGDFTSTAKALTVSQTLLSEGADILFPVAGSLGNSTAEAVQKAGPGHYMEWVDVDGCVSDPQYCSLFITSVTKGVTVSVSDAVEAAAKDRFTGGTYVGDLANDGVSLAPYHTFASKVPAAVKAKLNAIRLGIIAGKISVDPDSYPAST